MNIANVLRPAKLERTRSLILPACIDNCFLHTVARSTATAPPKDPLKVVTIVHEMENVGEVAAPLLNSVFFARATKLEYIKNVPYYQ